MSWYTLAETPGDYSMERLSIARDREKLIPYVKAALQIKPDIHLWGSPWVGPDWTMGNGSAMKSDAQTLEADALYLAKSVEEYANEGLTITTPSGTTPSTSPRVRRASGSVARMTRSPPRIRTAPSSPKSSTRAIPREQWPSK